MAPVPLLAILYCIGVVYAAFNPDFFLSVNTSCTSPTRLFSVNNCVGGLCAATSNSTYCCEPGDGHCFAAPVACTGSSSTDAGSGQRQCFGADQQGFCCHGNEKCGIKRTTSFCRSPFPNPYKLKSNETANATLAGLASSSPGAQTAQVSFNSESVGGSSQSGGSSLSGGAIAGIVLGSVALALLLGAAAFYFVRRRRGEPSGPPIPKGEENAASPQTADAKRADGSLFHVTSMRKVVHNELNGNAPAAILEADPWHAQIAELPDHGPLQELPANEEPGEKRDLSTDSNTSTTDSSRTRSDTDHELDSASQRSHTRLINPIVQHQNNNTTDRNPESIVIPVGQHENNNASQRNHEYVVSPVVAHPNDNSREHNLSSIVIPLAQNEGYTANQRNHEYIVSPVAERGTYNAIQHNNDYLVSPVVEDYNQDTRERFQSIVSPIAEREEESSDEDRGRSP